MQAGGTAGPDGERPGNGKKPPARGGFGDAVRNALLFWLGCACPVMPIAHFRLRNNLGTVRLSMHYHVLFQIAATTRRLHGKQGSVLRLVCGDRIQERTIAGLRCCTPLNSLPSSIILSPGSGCRQVYSHSCSQSGKPDRENGRSGERIQDEQNHQQVY